MFFLNLINYKKISLVFLIVLLSACASLSPPPAKTNPLSDLTLSSTLPNSSVNTVSQSKKKKMALIVSSGTTKTLKYLDEQAKSRKKNVLFQGKDVEDAIKASGDPHYLVNSIVSILKQQVAEVVLADDLNALKTGKYDIAGVLDVYHKRSRIGSWDEISEIKLIVINPKIEIVGEVNGKGVEPDCFNCSVAFAFSRWYLAQKKALESFSTDAPNLFKQ